MSGLLRPCIEARCSSLTYGTRCAEHEAQRERQLDRRRPSADTRGYDERHRAWRDAVLHRDRICRMCRAALATVADHVVPIRDGGARFDLANGQGLCAPCHNGPKQRADKRRRV